MVVLVMALLSFEESTPGAYGLKASNAAQSISTSIGTFPCGGDRLDCAPMIPRYERRAAGDPEPELAPEPKAEQKPEPTPKPKAVVQPKLGPRHLRRR
jgi:hypothetical protein